METIKAAYHRAALQSHPDKRPGGEDAFRNIQLAWECLREDRKAYDEQLLLQKVQSLNRVTNAVRLRKEDCTGPEFVVDEEGQDVQVWYFTCRCGHELDIEVGEREPVDCPGCSLIYDITMLQDSSSDL
jgi:hypothetical protein